jgi:hypothetical protein
MKIERYQVALYRGKQHIATLLHTDSPQIAMNRAQEFWMANRGKEENRGCNWQVLEQTTKKPIVHATLNAAQS